MMMRWVYVVIREGRRWCWWCHIESVECVVGDDLSYSSDVSVDSDIWRALLLVWLPILSTADERCDVICQLHGIGLITTCGRQTGIGINTHHNTVRQREMT